ncbi:eukaryotic translation initiation factor 3 subunit H [Diutina catenulata]
MASTVPTKTVTPPRATKISMQSSVLLSMVRHTSENFPQLFSGALLGFQSDEGDIDITHVFPFPYADQYEGGSFRSRSGAKYQQDIQTNLRKLGYGVEFHGWFQSSVSGNFVTTQLVEGLAQQQLTHPDAFVVVHNLANLKEVDVRAYRLSQSFLKAFVEGKWKSRDLAAAHVDYMGIFDELEVTVGSQALIDVYMSNNTGVDAPIVTSKRSGSANDILNLSSNENAIAQLLESLSSQIDGYNYDQNNFNYYQRQYQKESAKLSQWKQQRKLENFERQKRGESELSLDDHPQFKLPQEPSRYNNMLYSHAIDTLGDDALKKCDEELKKSHIIEKKLMA